MARRKGGLGTPMVLTDPNRGKKNRRREKTQRAKQKRLSGPVQTVYDRDSGRGRIPEKLTKCSEE